MAILRFSVFEIDSSSGELTRQGRRVPLAAQSFSVLLLLASRPNQVVTRLELRRVLWGDDTHVDFDRGLNFCVAALRRALGDDARRPRFVETIPTRGYRFIAEVRVVEPALVGNAPSPMRGTGQRRPSSGSATTWVMTAAVLWLTLQIPSTMRVHSRETASPGAIAAFDRGQDLWTQGPEARLQSLLAFEAAARIDARFAEAHYAVATTFVDLASRRLLPAPAALDQAERALRRTLHLEDVTAARQALGAVRLMRDWDWANAREELTRAIDLAPASDGALLAYARLLSASGDDESALEVVGRAETLNPACDNLAFESAVLHYRARRYDEALRRLDAARQLPQQIAVHDLAFLIHVQRQDWAAAQDEAAVLIRLHDSRSDLAAFVALDPQLAVKRFLDRSLETMRPGAISGAHPPTRMALIATLAGETKEALAWLERGLAERDLDLVYALRHPAFDTLRTFPRFLTVEAQVRRTLTGVRGSAGAPVRGFPERRHSAPGLVTNQDARSATGNPRTHGPAHPRTLF